MLKKIREYIANSLSDIDSEAIGIQDDLLGSGIIDSMGMMKLVVFIEKELNLKIPDADMTVEHFMTLQNIMDYLSQREDVDLQAT
ncbi:MAG TPA: phosphopantetheine-binding protein [Pricia sp.]|nr:phosphopantetheine-binding protein [Pricia sp.]